MNLQNDECFTQFRSIAPNRIEEFHSNGFLKRHFFPHKIYYLPKTGPDGYRIISWIFGNVDPAKMSEVVLYADASILQSLPEELFFDDDIIWHQQQYGMTGHVAVASLFVCDGNLFSLTHFSDIYQRISRRRELKTRVEKLFKGWPVLLLNSVLNFALENNLGNILTPTSELALQNTDKNRNPKKDLFERIYNLSVNRYYKAEKKDGWWKININDNRKKIVVPEKKREVIKKEKTICLAHDIEAGLGHIGVDSELVESANRNYKLYLTKMMEVEGYFKILVTYNIIGCLLNELREEIIKHHRTIGYCIAFHSYDHNPEEKQLSRCRKVDYRIKGYRPPQSKLTPELSNENLFVHNFEWMASSVSSLKTKKPKLEEGIVKIPIMFDDFSMYKDKVSYPDWEAKAIRTIEENNFVAFCLHDCYAQYWLPHYEDFLNKIRNLGRFKTLNQVAEEEFLINAL